MRLRCGCTIVPKSVLERFAADASLPPSTRKAFSETIVVERSWRQARAAQGRLVASRRTVSAMAPVALAASPSIVVFDCKHSASLPGVQIPNPGKSTDPTAKRTFDFTNDVAKFLMACFGRNSIDGIGGTMQSSIHYSVNYNNAFWNGSQMTYGDGDGNIFVDFTRSDDVVAHELAHGMTQYTANFDYTNEAGGLNESISDVFGSMFRQWRAGDDVTKADWLIGSDIIGPGAAKHGITCLRDLSQPGGSHCLSPQPSNFAKFVPGMDPHESSGIPNHAFYLAAKTYGGNSWDKVGKVWYSALTDKKATKSMKMKSFANLTRARAKALFVADAKLVSAIDSGWKSVGL